MVAKRGKDLLLKMTSSCGKMISVAGMRNRSLRFNSNAVDITDVTSKKNWRELLDNCGVKSAGISGAGIFKDANSDLIIRETFFTGRIKQWQIIIPEFCTFEGKFQITSLEYTGNYDGEIRFEIALESAGEITSSIISNKNIKTEKQ